MRTRNTVITRAAAFCFLALAARMAIGQDWWKPYSPPCTERESVFEFTEKPAVKLVGKDRYEITFAVKGYCDVTVAIVDPDPAKELVKGRGIVVRHLASGVLGTNAPAPFQKNSLKQTIYWNGKDDLDVYVKDPEKLQVRVMLGLKPEFDKRLGGTSPKNLPGYVWGIAIDLSGAYVFIKGPGAHGHVTLRKFDRDGNYVRTLFPPAHDMPADKLAGTGFIEYEPGVKAWHGHDVNETVSRDGYILPGADGKGVGECQVALAGNRLVYINAGSSLIAVQGASLLHYLFTDGSTDVNGMKGRPFAWGAHLLPRLAASPDGKWVYMVSDHGPYQFGPVVVRAPADGSEPAKVFVGHQKMPGGDNAHLNGPVGIDCDRQGRVYVADSLNNRIQIFSSDGTYLKTIPSDRPRLVRVHQKTGAIYVQHAARVQGQSIARLTKFHSFDDPQPEFSVDDIATSVMAIDSWSAKPRLWLAGAPQTTSHISGTSNDGRSVMIYEERDKTLTKVVDFDDDARAEAGANYMGRWSGSIFDKVVCDPTREYAYYRNRHFFDLRTGARLGSFRPNATSYDDIAFDKFGFMHVHFNPGFYMPGVGRVDPARARKDSGAKTADALFYPEVPYDYGIPATGSYKTDWAGILPTKCQPGAKFFQDGIGVNMRGEVAVESNIYYVPRMEEEGWRMAAAGIADRSKRGEYVDGSMGGSANNYAAYLRNIREKEKRGEEEYFIRRRPGIPLAGATVWTFDRTGELRDECAVVAGHLLGGVQIDEDGFLYFTANRPRLIGGKPFLFGRGGLNGTSAGTNTPFTGTWMKTKKKANILTKTSAIPLEDAPPRAAEVVDPGGTESWVDGVEWLYAGASPIVAGGCSCPSMRPYLDWWKRSFVPEAYRHSIGVLDANGNLIMHIGRYGNFDSANGPKSMVPVGGDGIGITMCRFVSCTDNYLVFDDWGERIVVLKLNYHAEATAPIGAR